MGTGVHFHVVTRAMLAAVGLGLAPAALAQVQFTISITNNSSSDWADGVIAVLPGGGVPNALLRSGQAPLLGEEPYHTYTYGHRACDQAGGEDDGDADLLITRWTLLTEGSNAWIVPGIASGDTVDTVITASPGDVMSFVARLPTSGDDVVMMHAVGDPADSTVDLFDNGGAALSAVAYDIGGYDLIDCGNTCPPVSGCNTTYGNGVVGGGAGGSQPPNPGGCEDQTWHADDDGDGFGDPSDSVDQCDPPSGWLLDATDCDDDDALASPGLAETPYDGIDNDCNPSTPDDDLDGDGLDQDADCDDGDAAVGGSLDWYADADSDGVGNAASVTQACQAPSGDVGVAGDCDDDEPLASPNLAESPYDGIDNDCDPATPDDDLDGDGLAQVADCDDGDAAVGGPASWFFDADDDGFGDPLDTTEACDLPVGHVAVGGDCDDLEPTVNPGAAELCNGVDDDCDGEIDVGALDPLEWYADTDNDGFGDPNATAVACDAPSGFTGDASDCDDDDPLVRPDAAEQCNEVDDDCDGAVDEDVAYVDWYPDADGDGDGDADAEPVNDCLAPAGTTDLAGDCDDTDDTVFTDAPELCDGLDNDCDGELDEGCPPPDSSRTWAPLVDTGVAEPGSGCDCDASGGGAPWALWAWMAAVLLRRPRDNATLP